MNFLAKYKFIIVGGLIAVGLTLLLVLGSDSITRKTPPDNSMTYSDPDTGETIISDKTRTPETATNTPVSLLGTRDVYDMMSSVQFITTRQLIESYIKNNVDRGVTLAKVMPLTVVRKASTIKFDVKIDSPETTLHVSVKLIKERAVDVAIVSSALPGKTYQSGVLPQETQSLD